MKEKNHNICPLCQSEPATKKSSHIFPRFMGVSILETKDDKRKGYTIGNKDKIKYGQDTPKEDYILCPQCESDIGKLETTLANNLIYKLKKSRYSLEFNPEKLNGFTKIYIPTIQNKDLKVAVLSMLFRAHISTLGPFINCRLTDEQISLIRNVLLQNKYTDVPMIILTSADQEYSKNIIHADTIAEHGNYILWVNDYVFLVSFNTSSPLIQNFQHILLQNENPPFLGIITQHDWDKLRKTLFKAVAN